MPFPNPRAIARLTRLVRHTVSSARSLERISAETEGCPHVATRAGHEWARRLIDALGVELHVTGKLPDGPALWLSNHRSYVDIPVILAQRPCAFLAKEEIASWPVFGRGAALNHTVFVKRGDPVSGKAARQGALHLLERGVPFAAFPEGTTSRGPGIRPFYPGLFQLAEQYGFPVVPIALEYESPDDAWVDDDAFVSHFLRRFGRKRIAVQLRIGPELHPGEVPDLRAAAEDCVESMLAA